MMKRMLVDDADAYDVVVAVVVVGMVVMVI